MYKVNLKYIYQHQEGDVAMVHINFPSPIPEEEIPILESNVKGIPGIDYPEYGIIMYMEG